MADLLAGRAARSCAVMHGRDPVAALRELLALQASDWAFIAYRDWAGDYPSSGRLIMRRLSPVP